MERVGPLCEHVATTAWTAPSAVTPSILTYPLPSRFRIACATPYCEPKIAAFAPDPDASPSQRSMSVLVSDTPCRADTASKGRVRDGD